MEFKSNLDVTLMDHHGSDEAMVAAARVSTIGAGVLDTPNAEKEGLINFLMRNRHGTPFEHNSMTFFVSAPIFVFREFHRHRVGWSYNEQSGRYMELEPVFYIPAPDRNLQQIGKTGEYEFVPGTEDQQRFVVNEMKYNCERAYRSYEMLLGAGIAKEVARMTLPVNIYSSMYATCNARSLMHFLGLRTNEPESTFPSKPMREIEIVARQMEDIFATLFPVTYAAWNENGRVAP